jgi:hypothetical protein
MKTIITVIFVSMLSITCTLAGIIRIPHDQPGIQAGINAAVNGDTVLVADSTYYENINFMGKAITVASYMIIDNDTTHRDSTIINGGLPGHPDSGSVVFFISGEDTNSVLHGFTITGGTGTLYDATFRIGGGIYCENSGAKILFNKIINNNVIYNQKCNGAGIGVWPIQNVNSVVIEDNVIANNSLNAMDGSNGGGIRLSQGIVARNKIYGNLSHAQAGYAGGGGISAGCEDTPIRTRVIIIDNEITHNQAVSDQFWISGNGGGIDNVCANIELVDNIISHNQIIGPSGLVGGGVRIWGVKDSVLVKNNTISFNSFLNGDCYGGGMHVSNSDLSTIPAKVIITGNRFDGNMGFYGGGLHTGHNPGCVVSDNEFINNFVVAEGGGICDYDSNPFIITNNIFKQNRSTNWGGGLSTSDSDVLMYNNIISENESQLGGGVLIYRYEPTLAFSAQIINNTITANIADSAGGIGLLDYEVVLMNTICWADSADFAPEILVKGAELYADYSDIQFGADSIKVTAGGVLNWLANNIDTDPLFELGDTLYHLSSYSPCVNVGIDSMLMAGFMVRCPANDYDGEVRPYPGTPPDIGADETHVPVSIESQPLVGIPQSYELCQNFPNPFNPLATIEFSIPKTEFVTLKIYNLLGQEVATLVSEKLTPGNYKYTWEASDFASGIYCYNLKTEGGYMETKKLILLK